MFDEYPDRLMLEQVTERIYQTVKNGTDTVMAEEFWGGNNPPYRHHRADREHAATTATAG